MKAHNFSIGVDQDHPVRQEGTLQSLVHLLVGWESDQELKRLKRLVRGALVVESDIREAVLVQTDLEWKPRFARNKAIDICIIQHEQ